MVDGAEARAREHEREGSVLNDKWTLERLIGSGGMGDVYAARHRNGARAAVKLLHAELARLPDVRQRFLREGYAANRVEHRGAVQVLDDDIVRGGPDDGSAFLVMELLDGESLQDRSMRPPRLEERDLLEIMDAVLDVLAAAHAHGVIHRDLKPENVFLANDPEREGVRVKLLDFGLARLAEASGGTSAGTAIGTPSFMAPEQASGRSADIDGRTDLFALAATMFRIVSGRRIHEAPNAVNVVVMMATTPAPLLRTVAPDTSEAFAKIIDRALTFDRAGRFPDARAMQAAVRDALEGLPADAGRAIHLIPASDRALPAALAADTDEADESDPRSNEDDRATRRPDPPKPPAEPPISAAADPEVPDSTGRARDSRPVPPPRTPEPDRAPSPIPPAAPSSATLPWVLVLILLAVGAWKLGPSLQEELVRRASQWTTTPQAPTPTTTATAPANGGLADAAPTPTAIPDAATSAAPEPTASTVDPSPEALEADADVEPPPPVASAVPVASAFPAVEATSARDAGAPRQPVVARPHPSARPATKPAAKKPGPAPTAPKHPSKTR